MSIPRAGITPRAKVLLPLFLIVLIGASYYRLWLKKADFAGPYVLEGRTMGTTYKVLVSQVRLSEEETSKTQAAIQAELDRVEGLMSTYKADSEVSRFNAFKGEGPFQVSEDTAKVVEAGQRIAAQTRGAFDVTVRPLVALWGFGANAKASAPTEQQIQNAKQQTGYQALSVEGTTLEKGIPGLQIDLSAIAKGYGVDRVTAVLEERGVHNAMVEVGGEVRLLGEKAPKVPWRIGIESPTEGKRGTQRVLALTDIAMATSGDYRNYYEKDGVRLSHTIDPRIARPIKHALASVTVMHKQAMWADGYATAINVLGPKDGMAFAEQHSLAVFLIVRKGDGAFETRESSAFSKRFSAAAP